MDWRDRLIVNWSDNEKEQYKEWISTKNAEDMKKMQSALHCKYKAVKDTTKLGYSFAV